MNKLKIFTNFTKRHFGQIYSGISGDVNWKDGKLIDGRPNINRGRTDLPKRRYGNQDLTSSDYAEIVKELNNPIYLTYNKSKRGSGNLLDIPQEKHNKK